MAGIFREYDLNTQYENIDFVQVATDTLQNGYIVVANDLVGSYNDGFGDVYTPVEPTDVSNTDLAIVCSPEYYQDAYGNRVNIDDPTKITFATGQRIRVLRPTLNKKYFISNGLVSGTVAKGKYVYSAATSTGSVSSYTWTVGTTIPASATIAFYVEADTVNDTFVGLTPVTGARIRCVRSAGH